MASSHTTGGSIKKVENFVRSRYWSLDDGGEQQLLLDDDDDDGETLAMARGNFRVSAHHP